MKFNKWTTGLAAVGVISLASAARADEKMSQLQTALSNTTISGYVDTAAQWNIGSQNGGNTPGSLGLIGNAGNNDGFTLNAVDIALDKPEDAGAWASGYHVELMYGPSSQPYGNTPGNNVTINNGAGGNAANIRQAYVVVRTPLGSNGIDWKVGVWDTIIGYEGTTDGSNPNYTRSYGYGLEPTTHTGVLGTYKINDEITVQAGVADGSNTPGGVAGVNGVAALESQKAYLGAVAFTAPDSWGWAKGTSINAGVIDAVDSKGPGTFGGSTSLYAGATVPTPIAALKFGAAFDYVDFHDAGHAAPPAFGFRPGNSDSSAWSAGLYANYQYNDKLSFNGRAEHLAINNSGLTADEFTLTTSYQLWANVISRVEFRWDHAEHGTPFDLASNGAANPGNPGIHDNAYLLALNLIYQF